MADKPMATKTAEKRVDKLSQGFQTLNDLLALPINADSETHIHIISRASGICKFSMEVTNKHSI